MSTTDKHTAARNRMADFVARQTGAELDRDPIVFDEKIVLSGEQVECEKVRAYMADVLGVAGCVVDELDPELETWTCVRIPLAGLESALAHLTASVRK